MDVRLLHGDGNPGDASANGRKPETGIKVGAADGLGEKHWHLPSRRTRS